MDVLVSVLSEMLAITIVHADYQTDTLHGGTLGDVQRISGIAESGDGEKLPYKLVLKTHKKWARFGDPGSWRREYDLYLSDLGAAFTGSLRWPTCYRAEMNAEETEITLWMEYIEGVSGLDLTGDMYECAAEALGRFQGKLCAGQPAFFKDLTNLSALDYAKRFYLHYRSWDVVYDYIRSDGCELPPHICQMLIDIDDHSDAVFERIGKLPVVLCHRDFWVANIFHSDGGTVLIDWDTAGWGYLGEDIASLIADEADVEHMVEYYQRCVPAYYKGFSEYVDTSHITDNCIPELILILFGYRLVEWYLNAGPDEKSCT